MNEQIAKTMTYGGGSGAVIFGWNADTVGMVCGVLIGIAGLILTWFYKRRQDKRQQQEFEMRMAKGRQ